MELIHPQISAFAAVVEEGTFEAAAQRLSLTASALSQRIKLLESRLGQTLLIRRPPCRPAMSGQKLLQRIRLIRILESEALAELNVASKSNPSNPLTISVTSESLQTWVMTALARLYREHGFQFNVRIEDGNRELSLLREGVAMGAITTVSDPINGCDALPLGMMRYVAVASPEFAAHYFPRGIDSIVLSRAPMLVFGGRHELSLQFVRKITRAKIRPPIQNLPSPASYIDAITAGLGWCMAPARLLEAEIERRKVVVIDDCRRLEVSVYWQHWSLESSSLKLIGDTFFDCSRAWLDDPANDPKT